MKIVIADDEILTLQLMEKILDWDAMGIEIAGLAKDGVEAWSMIEKEHPEILITDIKMPHLDGLELIKRVRSIDKNLKIIIVSAHNEFEYAQKALTYGVGGYVLKPIDEYKLKEIVDKLAKEINEERENEDKYSESRIIARDRILRQLLYARMDIRELTEILYKLRIPIDFECYQVMNVSVDSLSYHEHIRFDEISDTQSADIVNLIKACAEKENKKVTVFEGSSGEWIGILNFETDCNHENKMGDTRKMAETCISRLKSEVGIKCFLGVSGFYGGSEELFKAYGETINLIKYRFYFGDMDIIFSGDVAKTFRIQDIKSLEQQKLFIEYLKCGKEDEAIKLVENIFKNIESAASMEPDLIYSFFFELLLLTRQELMKDNIQNSDLGGILNEITIDKIKKYRTLQNLSIYIRHVVTGIARALLAGKNRENNRIIQKVREYINEKYDTDLALKDICDSIAVSKNYLCYLFKRETGEGIWDYLTCFRIEKSKEFIRNTDLKNYEISYKIGYENPSYFSKMFRKYTGMTPNEFRSKITR